MKIPVHNLPFKKRGKKGVYLRDRGALSQAMIIVIGLATAAVVVLAGISVVLLDKGEATSKCVNNFSTVNSGGSVQEDCSIEGTSGNGGTLPPGDGGSITPGEPIEGGGDNKEDNSLVDYTDESCFDFSNGTIHRYLIAENPILCGKDVNIPEEIDGETVTTIGVGSFAIYDFARDDECLEWRPYATMPTDLIVADYEISEEDFFWENWNLDEMNMLKDEQYRSTDKTEDPDFMQKFSAVDKRCFDMDSWEGAWDEREAMYNNDYNENPPIIVGAGANSFWDKIDEIGRERGNYKINSVTFPNTVTEIKKTAFLENNLSTVSIPESVEKIGDYAFSNNRNLETVNFSEGIKELGFMSFAFTNINSLVFPDSLASIRSAAFYRSGLTNVSDMNNVEFIGNDAFADNNLQLVPEMKKVKHIGHYAFAGNSEMKTKDGWDFHYKEVTTEEEWGTWTRNEPVLAFYRWELPESVKTTGAFIFQDASQIKEVTVKDTVDNPHRKTFCYAGISKDEDLIKPDHMDLTLCSGALPPITPE